MKKQLSKLLNIEDRPLKKSAAPLTDEKKLSLLNPSRSEPDKVKSSQDSKRPTISVSSLDDKKRPMKMLDRLGSMIMKDLVPRQASRLEKSIS